MNFLRPKSLLALLVLTLPLVASGAVRPNGDASSDATEFFERHIRPVLMEACFKCHAGEKTSRGLSVNSREALVKGGESGSGIVPGEPEKSLVIQVIRRRHGDVKLEKELPAGTVANFVRWISDAPFGPNTN